MKIQKFIPVIALLMLTQSAFAVKIADITRLDGQRTNVIAGMGLVIGLKGTGDGGAYLPAMKSLANLLTRFNSPTAIADLSNAANVAIVQVYITLPADGVHNGEHLDVHVMSTGAASSLKNGTLYLASVLGPTGKPYTPHDAQGNALPPIPFAVANGGVELEDITVPTSGIVKGGGVMEVDLEPRVIDNAGYFKLIIDEPSASQMMATAIAKVINESDESGGDIAIPLGANSVVVRIPKSDLPAPVPFIANILKLPIRQDNASTEARVRINNKTGTMIITGDVEISPTVISQKGLTITTVNPPPVATARNPQITSKQVIPLDTTNTGGARLQDLASAFDQLKVPAEDRITIIKELHKTGRIRAKLIIDGQDQ